MATVERSTAHIVDSRSVVGRATTFVINIAMPCKYCAAHTYMHTDSTVHFPCKYCAAHTYMHTDSTVHFPCNRESDSS